MGARVVPESSAGALYASACYHYGVAARGIVVGDPEAIMVTVTQTIQLMTTVTIPATTTGKSILQVA